MDLTPYIGKFVALDENRKVVLASDDLKDLLRQIDEKHPNKKLCLSSVPDPNLIMVPTPFLR